MPSPRLRFDGNQAGFVVDAKAQASKGAGNASSPFDYSLFCGCGAFLGVLGGFRANEAGQRSCYCPKCEHCTIISATGQILAHKPYDITANPAARAS